MVMPTYVSEVYTNPELITISNIFVYRHAFVYTPTIEFLNNFL